VAGARQIECTINGIGERAGNCSLEEVVMALATRAAFFNIGTGVQTARLYPTCRLVASITGVSIPRNKAVVGENAFAHESGIHQHGMLQNRSTYEIMRPEDVGLQRSNLVLGKHSGRHAFRERVKQLGFELEELELNRVFEEFKALADRKKELFDGDIEALVLRAGSQAQGPWTLEHLDVEAHSGSQAIARVRLKHADGRTLEAISILKELGTPLLIHQPSYSMLNRWIEERLLDVLGDEGVGCIAFSPLAQGLLTNRYLNGIPEGSRASRDSSLSLDLLSKENLDRVRGLSGIAEQRGQKISQLALAWALRDARVTSVLVGASSVAQLEENVAALDNLDFTSEELALIDQFAVEGAINLWRGPSTS